MHVLAALFDAHDVWDAVVVAVVGAAVTLGWRLLDRIKTVEEDNQELREWMAALTGQVPGRTEKVTKRGASAGSD